MALVGGCSLAEVLARPAWELDVWAAYWLIQPFGPWADDLRIARIGALIGSLRGRKKKVEAFMWKPKIPATTEEESEKERQAEHERKRRAFDWRASRDRWRAYTERTGGTVIEKKEEKGGE